MEIIVEGTNLRVYTDFDGNFTIPDLEPGSYNLRTSMILYGELSFRNIKALPGSGTIEMKLHSR